MSTKLSIPEREAILLSTVMSNPTLFALSGALLSPSDLTPKHQIIFEAARSLSENGKPLSRDALLFHLGDSGKLETVGGNPYITTVATIPSVDEGTMRQLCAEIVNAGRNRKLKQQFADLMQIDDDADADTTIEKAVGSLYGMTRQADEGIIDIADAVALYGDMERDGAIRTGIDPLDQTMHNLCPADYVVVGARPSAGKTVFGSQVALMAATSDHPALFFSLEQSKRSLTGRFQKMIGREALTNLRGKLILKAEPGITMDKIFYQSQLSKMTHNIEVVIIDYVQLIGGQPSDMSVNDFLTGVSTKLRILANRLEVVVILISQLNRENARANEKPGLHHFRGCGSLEQDADIGILLHRTPGSELGEIQLAKMREGETMDWTRIRFDKERLFFVAA